MCKRLLIGIGLLLVGFTLPTKAADLTLSPGRIELEVKAGSERTVALTAGYPKNDDQTITPNARLVVRFNDWTIKSTGEFVLSPAHTLPRSASGWLMVSPGEFILTPGTNQPIRLTISVPADTKPGVYYAAVFIEERTPPPAVKPGERRVVLRYRLGSILYVLVPDLVRKGDLSDLKVSAEQDKVIINPLLKNMGNAHVRPRQTAQIKNAAGEIVAELKSQDTPVLLPDNELGLQLSLPVRLPPGKYMVFYSVDFRDDKPVQVGQVPLEVAAALPKSP